MLDVCDAAVGLVLLADRKREGFLWMLKNLKAILQLHLPQQLIQASHPSAIQIGLWYFISPFILKSAGIRRIFILLFCSEEEIFNAISVSRA